jgi:hypothetical protein
MYRAMSAADRDPDVSCFVIYGNETIGPILSGVTDRGLLVHPRRRGRTNMGAVL